MNASARSGVRYGLVPNLAPEVAVFAGVGKGAWEASLGLSWTLESTTATTLTDGTVESAFGMNVAWLGGCFHPLRFARVVFSACAHVGGGASNVTLLSGDVTRLLSAGQAPWVGAQLQPRLRLLPRSNLIIEIGADLTVPITRRDYSLCASTHVTNCPANQRLYVFQQTIVGASGFLGVGTSIP